MAVLDLKHIRIDHNEIYITVCKNNFKYLHVDKRPLTKRNTGSDFDFVSSETLINIPVQQISIYT